MRDEGRNDGSWKEKSFWWTSYLEFLSILYKGTLFYREQILWHQVVLVPIEYYFCFRAADTGFYIFDWKLWLVQQNVWGFFVWRMILLIAHNRRICWLEVYYFYVSDSEYAEAVLIMLQQAHFFSLLVLCKDRCLLANVTFQLTCHISFICFINYIGSSK